MFFSVKEPILLFGKKFVPCVCYEATRPMEATIKDLEAKGKAVTYEERVFFQNGKVLKPLAERKAEKKAEEKAKAHSEKKAEKEAKKKAKEDKIEDEVKEDFDSSDF